MKIKRLAAAVAVALPAGATMMVTAQPALAATPSCGGNLCAEATSVNGNVATIRAWARYSNFAGHFELQTPNHRTLNSISSYWHAGGTGNYFNNINGGVGRWCVTEWEAFTGSNGGGVQYHDIGYACVSA